VRCLHAAPASAADHLNSAQIWSTPQWWCAAAFTRGDR
jgi:hypothetical protein